MSTDPVVATAGLRMLRLRLELRSLFELGRRRHIPYEADDLGYLIHSHLRETFGERAPHVFAIDRRDGAWIDVLAYGFEDSAALREHADRFTDPVLHASHDWTRFHSKPMPERWETGLCLGFRVRVCPVVRTKARDNGERGKPQERDPYLARALAGTLSGSDRESIYRDWLAQAFVRSGGATLDQARMEAFSLRRLVRRDHEHRPRLVPLRQKDDRGDEGKPDAAFTGIMTVTDSEAFNRLLIRGIGRHRAFGFGMVLLRPANG